MEDRVATNEIELAAAFAARWERLEIEVGSGNGHFLAEYGSRRRDCGILGIESKRRRCEKIEKKVRAGALANVLVYLGKAEPLFERLPAGSADAFHVYFPDPWPKTKHRKRRLFNLKTLDTFHRILKRGGLVYFSSDVFDYYLQAKVLGLWHGGFRVLDEPLPPEAVLSIYSLKTEAAGKRLRDLVLSRL